MLGSDQCSSPASFVASLILAAAATLCKETGIAVYMLAAGNEVVSFFDGKAWRTAHAKASGAGRYLTGGRAVFSSTVCFATR